MSADVARITNISVQARDKSRVNISVDGKYRFSLDITQVADLGVRVGAEYTEEQLKHLEDESVFGKVYTRALEYALTRPRSQKELRDYLYRKTRDSRTKEGAVKKGVSKEVTARVYDRLTNKGYVNDENFARYWVENRQLRKGASRRKLQAELRAKGVDSSIITANLESTERSDAEEIQKVIHKKIARYEDEQKLIQYLVRQGFSYDDSKAGVVAYREQGDEN